MTFPDRVVLSVCSLFIGFNGVTLADRTCFLRVIGELTARPVVARELRPDDVTDAVLLAFPADAGQLVTAISLTLLAGGHDRGSFNFFF
jgi:hypothetical protein